MSTGISGELCGGALNVKLQQEGSASLTKTKGADRMKADNRIETLRWNRRDCRIAGKQVRILCSAAAV